MQSQSDAPAAKSSSGQMVRKFMHYGLPFIGAQIIISVMLFTQALPNMALVVLGFLLIEVGIWKLAPKLIPDKRQYHALRSQTDQFLNLVRWLNAAALRVKENDTPENRQAIEDIQQKMKRQVERMAAVAGKTDAELTANINLTGKNGAVPVAS